MSHYYRFAEPKYKEQLAKAARWIYERRERSGTLLHFRWPVLTHLNSVDPDCLHLDVPTSLRIFADLTSRRMLHSAGPTNPDELIVNIGADDQWHAVMHPMRHLFLSGAVWLFQQFLGGTIGFAIGVIGGYLVTAAN